MDDSSPASRAKRTAGLLADADLCVKCGLCLPHCPTYRETRDESESPRGRIALAQGLLAGRLRLTPRLRAHLDRCLECRACEAVCPAQVPYGRLMEGVRAEIRRRRPAGPVRRFLQRVVAEGFVQRPAWIQALLRVLRAWQESRLESGSRRLLAVLSPPLARLLRYLPRLHPPAAWAQLYPAVGAARGEVALFLGCVAREVDRETLEATIQVLCRLGYDVRVPQGQGCCGAVHLHAGHEVEAVRLAARNVEAFAQYPGLPVVVTASGCAATLVDYGRLPGLDEGLRGRAAELAGRAVEACSLLATLPWPEAVELAPLPERVAVHEPCTQRNALRRPAAAYRVLERIPRIDLVSLPDNHRCCGAAGAYLVTQPVMADRLRLHKVEAMVASGAGTVVTTNVGCALHLRAGLAEGVDGPEVVHPLVLLARQFEAGDRDEPARAGATAPWGPPAARAGASRRQPVDGHR
jgi:glycolate oxidase iron-sulfur subunit